MNSCNWMTTVNCLFYASDSFIGVYCKIAHCLVAILNLQNFSILAYLYGSAGLIEPYLSLNCLESFLVIII